MSEQTVDAFLAHHGVKGMRWGKRSVKPSSGKLGTGSRTKKDLKALDKASKLADRAKADAQIEAARKRYDTSAKKNYQRAKAQYQIDKQTIGRREAAKAFNKVKEKNLQDYNLASQAKSGKETTHALMLAAGGVVLMAAAQSLR